MTATEDAYRFECVWIDGNRLPFELVPLIRLAADPTKMGRHANARWLNVLASIVAGVIIAFDLRLIAGALP